MHDKLLVPLSPWAAFAVGPDGVGRVGPVPAVEKRACNDQSHFGINESGVLNYRTRAKIESIIITKSAAVPRKSV